MKLSAIFIKVESSLPYLPNNIAVVTDVFIIFSTKVGSFLCSTRKTFNDPSANDTITPFMLFI